MVPKREKVSDLRESARPQVISVDPVFVVVRLASQDSEVKHG